MAKRQKPESVEEPETEVESTSETQTYPVPSLGRTVHYVLTEQNAKEVNDRRLKSQHRLIKTHPLALQPYKGNQAIAGQTCAMTIVRIWGTDPHAAVNGQVLLDGDDSLWVTSVTVGEGPGHFSWPPRV